MTRLPSALVRINTRHRSRPRATSRRPSSSVSSSPPAAALSLRLPNSSMTSRFSASTPLPGAAGVIFVSKRPSIASAAIWVSVASCISIASSKA
ncbi:MULTISPECIES: hypothetical protein [Bradyrhizobium]|uniref:hypothetical protein n=1 Tax=Bradyrhizobium TaxID=374 RepID=UPI001FCE111D|nr:MULTISPECIES: hypothetical protein [Bradyrhizobium]